MSIRPDRSDGRLPAGALRWREAGCVLSILLAALPVMPLEAGVGNGTSSPKEVVSASPEMETGDWLEWQTMTGDWGGWRTRLANDGFEPFAGYTSELLSNVAGGLDTGANLNGFVEFGFTLDYEKMIGWEGASFTVDWHWYHGNTISQNLVGINPGENVSGYEASQAFRFYHIYQQQSFLDDKLIFRLGQMASDDYFALADSSGFFFNAAFGALPTTDTVSNVPIYPLTAPAVYIYAEPSDWFSLQTAIFTADAGVDDVTNNGFGWTVGGRAGIAAFMELRFDFALGELPSTVKLGGMYDTGPHLDVLTGNNRDGAGDWWVVLEQALAVDEQGNTKVSAFSVISGAPEPDVVALDFWASLGFSFFGVVPSRPDDVFGIAMGYSEVGSEGRIVFESATGIPSPPNTTYLEMTYQYQVTPWLQLQPDVQMFFNPNFATENAYTVNFRTIFTF